VVSADRVPAVIGGDLRIDSLQDRLRYKERSQQVGGSVTLGAGAGGSFSASGSHIDSEYASVGEQSGLRAGDGGFDVHVKGKTTLNGGAVTSTQAAVDAGHNRFESEGGVALSDLQNRETHTAESAGVTVGVGQQRSSSGMGWGSDQGEAGSTTKAAITGMAGDRAARTGDAGTGLTPTFDKDRVRDEVDAQVSITKGFGQQAVPLASRYADQQAVALRREGKEDEARKWDEGGENRVGLHAAVGLLSGGAAGAAGAATGAALIPSVGEVVAELGLPEPVREAVTQVAGLALGAVGGGAGAAASLNQTAHNYLSRSPYGAVRRRVSQENARLTAQCGDRCTAADFRRIDQQMAALEASATLAESARHGGLDTEQAMKLAQLTAELIPFYGTSEALAQLITGRTSLTSEEANRFWAAVGLVPIAGGVAKRVGEPLVDVLNVLIKGGESIKAGGAASDALKARSAAQASQLRQELQDLSKIAPDTSRDAEYIARTDQQVLKDNRFDMDHVLEGEINSKGKATGYHAELAADGASRIKPGAEVKYNDNGTYEAPVQIWDESKRTWIDKPGQGSTFFPPSWSQARIDYEASEAFKSKQMLDATKWRGTSPSGVVIEGFTTPARTTFYPFK
jgi:filamentous hemagglutinin